MLRQTNMMPNYCATVFLLLDISFWILRLSLGLQMTGLNVDKNPGWTSAEYPDIRAKPWTDQCGKHVPQFGYVCDPSPEAIIKKQEAYLLNEMLIDLAKTTKCNCQRRSQCMTKFHTDVLSIGPQSQVQIGFIVAIAFVHKLSSQGFSSVQAAAEKFSKIVRTRWGLGDCGNMALILVWDEHQLIHISTDEDLAASYLTRKEADQIVASVNDKINNREYLLALEQILRRLKLEFNGEQKKPIDIGILALAVSSGVALVVVGIITICVCAFRCCGNLRNAPLKEVIERVENLRTEFSNRVANNNNNNNAIPAPENFQTQDDVFSNRISDNNLPNLIREESASAFLDGKHSLV